MTANKLADKWIKELKEWGYDYDGMLEVFALAETKYLNLITPVPDKKILHLTVEKKWFDLMAKGIKKIEYRLMKLYWHNRLTNTGFFDLNNKNRYVQFDEIHIRNGYNPKSPFARFKHIKTDTTPPKLIAFSDGTKLHLEGSCYQIHLGEILEIKNWNIKD